MIHHVLCVRNNCVAIENIDNRLCCTNVLQMICIGLQLMILNLLWVCQIACIEAHYVIYYRIFHLRVRHGMPLHSRLLKFYYRIIP